MRRSFGSARPIRRQLARIVLIPSVSFLVLWSVMSVWTTIEAMSLTVSTFNGRDAVASVEDIGAQLRQERRATQVYLGAAGDTSRSELAVHRGETDSAVDELSAQISRLATQRDPGTSTAASDLIGGLDELDELRFEVDAGSVERAEALDRYTNLLHSVHELFDATSRSLADHGSLADGLLAVQILRAADRHSQADALLAGSLAAGEMTYPETAHFTYLTAAYREGLREAREKMAPDIRRRYEAMLRSGEWERVEQLSGAVVMRDPLTDPVLPDGNAAWNAAVPLTAQEWDEANAELEPALHELASGQAYRSVGAARDAALRLAGITVAGIVAALLAGVLAIVVALRSSRKLTRRLQRLRKQTLEGAGERLPDIVSRAGQGKRVAVSEEMPPLRYGRDEIGEVADAFNTAQRTAVGAAVKQAEIKRGANRVFLGIAYRNQALIQRQLRMIGEIAAAETDSAKHRELLRLDHLATRSRRYADNLIILSGAQSTRGWRCEMPLEEVLRDAVSETEDVERVRLHPAPGIEVRGVAVADTVHLLAELVENAAQFSPASSVVDVNSGAVAGGVTVEVEDRGLGMAPEAYTAVNQTLAKAPEFDVMALHEEPRLGIFVVARLAERHGIRVRLSPSPYGGTRAVVLLPDGVLAVGGSNEYHLPPARTAADDARA